MGEQVPQPCPCVFAGRVFSLEPWLNPRPGPVLQTSTKAPPGIALRPRPALRLAVEGHSDNTGNAEPNRQLSQQRATAVCLYLVAHGVPTAQLRPVGCGGTRPVADNNAPAQRPRNRRVVLVAEQQTLAGQRAGHCCRPNYGGSKNEHEPILLSIIE